MPNDGSVDPGTAVMPDDGEWPDGGKIPTAGGMLGSAVEGGAAGAGSIVDGVSVVADCGRPERFAGAAMPPAVVPLPAWPPGVRLAAGAGGVSGCTVCDAFIATATRTMSASTNRPAPMI